MPDQDTFDATAAAKAWPRCPERLIESLRAYVEGRIRPGKFLCAVLENNLGEAIGRADDDSMERLKDIYGVVYNHIPLRAWGSKAAMERWLQRRENEVVDEAPVA